MAAEVDLAVSLMNVQGSFRGTTQLSDVDASDLVFTEIQFENGRGPPFSISQCTTFSGR
jgi:hypothetical protein